MKTLILISGTMGVGKTSVSLELKRLFPRCVFLDGDWCWDMSPFVVCEETKAMVLGNIRHLLISFLTCSVYDNILFCWVMHEAEIFDAVLAGLPLEGVRLYKISLVCSEPALRERLGKDIAAGLRERDVLNRSIIRMGNYDAMDTIKVDVSKITAAQAAQEIRNLLSERGRQP